jgi:DNA (cytosine-5)-methyltransferase 1
MNNNDNAHQQQQQLPTESSRNSSMTLHMEWVLVLPPQFTQIVYQLLIRTKCVPRPWHTEGRYGSRTHVHYDTHNPNRRMVGIPVLSADRVQAAMTTNVELQNLLQSFDENGHRMVDLLYKSYTPSKRAHVPPPFDAQIHPERAPLDAMSLIADPTVLHRIPWWPPSQPPPCHQQYSDSTNDHVQEHCNHPAATIPAFTFAELFAGMGGFGVALEALGGECIFCSEIDATCRMVYTSNLRIAPHNVYGNIHDVTDQELPLRGSLDLLVAGFPCQPFSTLGHQPGLDCPQGNLFLEIVRVLRISKPHAFLLENVPGLLQMSETIKIIVDALESAGYVVSMEICDARGLTAQTRKRLYVVGLRQQNTTENLTAHIINVSADSSISDTTTVDPFRFPYIPDLGLRAEDVIQYEPLSVEDEELLRISDEQLHRMNTEKYWKPAHLAWPNTIIDTLVSHYGKSVARGHSQLVPGSATTDHVSPMSTNPRRFTPRECARIMGFPGTYVLPDKTDPNQCGMARNKEWYQMFGNAVCPPVVAAIAGAILDRCPHMSHYDAHTDWITWGRTVAVQLAHSAKLPTRNSETIVQNNVCGKNSTLSVTTKHDRTLTEILQDAIAGLLFTSESDYSLTVFELPTTTPNIAIDNALTILLSTDMPSSIDKDHRQYWSVIPTIVTSSLDWFFDRYTIVQDWWEPVQHSALRRWQQLRDIFTNDDRLSNVQVFRIGQSTDWGLSGSTDVFIIGHHGTGCTGIFVGLHTVSVET